MINIDFKNADLHLHSTYSDGTDTPEELLLKVKEAGLDVFSLTDHDAYAGCDEMREIIKEDDPFFISGVELSCKDERGKYHILGYGYDISKPAIFKAINKTHEMRMEKAKNRIEFLEKECGFPLTNEEKVWILSLKNPGRPHFAELLLKKGYTKTKAEGFELLAKCKSGTKVLSPIDAIDAILGSNGIPVLAHGILGDGSRDLSPDEIEAIVVRLKAAGLMGLECYYSGYTERQKEIMLHLAEKYNMLITAGSDYHGLKKPIAIGETNSPDPEKLKRFFEAVVLAANE